MKTCAFLLVASAAQTDAATPPDDAIHRGVPNAPAIDFSRDIRPVLAARCFACHGPDADARKARLRMDIPDGPFAGRRPAIIKGDAHASLIMERITASDPDDRMPPSGQP